MSIDPRTFRQTVGQFVTGVTVIAMEVDGSIRALTANSFTSLSLNPPLVLFCLGKGTKAGQLIHDVTEFSVNILSQEQRPLSSYFAGTWKGDTPPAFSFTRSEGGPRLDGSVAAIGCHVKAVHEGGDHWIVVGQVVSIHRSELPRAPLVFFGGRYSSLAGEQSFGEEAGLIIAWSEPGK
jgi:flavin reductase (DIM6/NTAB) family NADH-FMN oxidoreductase RutF